MSLPESESNVLCSFHFHINEVSCFGLRRSEVAKLVPTTCVNYNQSTPGIDQMGIERKLNFLPWSTIYTMDGLNE